MTVRTEDLRTDGADSATVIARLHAFLTAVAWFELERRRPQVCELSVAQVNELVRDAAKRAEIAVLERLGDYHGQSRFEVWAAKFAIRETAVTVRRHNDATDYHLRISAGKR